MKFKRKLKRKIFLKKTTWFVLALFAITMVYIPKLKASADTPPGTIDADVLKILEIAPGDQYALQCTDNVPLTTGTGKKYQVTHMDMSQYNSMVDDVAGLYDAIVISNNVGGANMSTDNTNPFWTNKLYRQYTPPYTQEASTAYYLNGGSYSGYSTSAGSLIEYFNENDITKKRAKNIVDMINKGQAVYIDNSITKNNKTIDLSTTNLYKTFTDTAVTNKSNFKQVATSELTIDKIVATLSANSSDTKRPKVTQVDGPDSEVRNTNGTVDAKRTLNFTVNANAESNEKLKINLYLDYNGDGLFTEDEKASIQLADTNDVVQDLKVDGANASKTYKFTNQLYNSFIGYLDWKVDVVRINSDGSDGPKTSTLGNVTMKNLNGKKAIKVLQIYPNSNTAPFFYGSQQYGNTRLSLNSTFTNMLKSIDDYDIQLSDMSVTEFQTKYGDATEKGKLKDDYDMIIVGFADNFNKVDFTNNDALANLDDFIAKGKSVMFTHDTISLASWGQVGGDQNFTNHYRDIVGQARYPDPKRVDANGNIITTNLNGTQITHDQLPTGKISMGQTAFSKDTNLWKSTQVTKIKSINKAQISKYPFDLTNFNGNNDGIVNVSLTHTQWYQLNLEDPDVVPWYNLVGNNMDNGDSRNFYYTYSKKNITYSGTGHSGVGSSTQEFELFINTMIKADRGSESPPVVKNMQDDANQTEIADGSSISNIERTSESYSFLTRVEDPNNDALKVNITADGKTDGLTMTTVNADASKNVTVNQGDTVPTNTLIRVTIPNSIYKDKTSTQPFTVSVTATDPFAEKDTKTFNVTTNGNSAPTITNYENDAQTVIGDGTEVSTPKDTDYKFITVPVDTDADDMNLLSLSVKINDVEINPAQLSIAGDTFTNGKITTSSKVQVTVPQSALQNLTPGDSNSYITITTTATDTHKVATTKSFKVYVSAPQPTVSAHGVQIIYNNNDVVETDISSDGSDYNRFIQGSLYSTVTQGTVTPNTEWYSKNFAGILSNLYGKDYTVELKVDSNLKVTSDVLLYKITNGVISDQPNAKMTLNNGGIYTTDFTSQPTDSEKLTGTSYFVTYTAELKAMPTNGKSFVNTLSVILKEDPTKFDGRISTTKFETITEDNDLF